LLLVDKPPGVTSTQVVNQIKWLTKPRRIGHAGTLDPFATGLLVVCFNQATKLAGHLAQQDKVYQGTVRLGIETDTQDLTGEIIRRKPVLVGPEEIMLAAGKLTGTISQKPPAYSALKQNGERLYKKARRGEEVEVQPREVTVFRLDVTEIELPKVHFEVHCSKGTYVRALAHDWGRLLGCGGHLEVLRRLSSGPFSIEQALILGQIEASVRRGRLGQRLISPAAALDWPGAVLNPDSAARVAQGRALSSQELSGLPAQYFRVGQRIKLTNRQGDLIALAELAVAADGRGLAVQPIRVLRG
jgi:tRNA pseudouridine55 synthase